jgi:hypothetical protein
MSLLMSPDFAVPCFKAAHHGFFLGSEPDVQALVLAGVPVFLAGVSTCGVLFLAFRARLGRTI